MSKNNTLSENYDQLADKIKLHLNKPQNLKIIFMPKHLLDYNPSLLNKDEYVSSFKFFREGEEHSVHIYECDDTQLIGVLD